MRTCWMLLLMIGWIFPRVFAEVSVPRPNFIVINIDDLGYADIGPFGSTLNRTPHLDRMAREGRKLTSFYAAPVCSPSRAALMTVVIPNESCRFLESCSPPTISVCLPMKLPLRKCSKGSATRRLSSENGTSVINRNSCPISKDSISILAFPIPTIWDLLRTG